jgi:RimJ/RimL family protein N-acetyltransferase
MPASSPPRALPLEFGIWDVGQLVGSVELVSVDPPRYGLGYWLAESACGRGLATVAVEAIIRYAEKDLGATDIFAGVTHGNHKSIAVLELARFNVAAEFETYTRYHLALK